MPSRTLNTDHIHTNPPTDDALRTTAALAPRSASIGHARHHTLRGLSDRKPQAIGHVVPLPHLLTSRFA